MKETILITGASSGFGLMLATKLHENGYHVIGTSRNPEKIHVPFQMLALDIADDYSIASFSRELFKHISKLDALVNNAGYNLSGLIEETTIEQAKELFETNFWGTVKVTNELLPILRKQKFGKIITVGSFLGLTNFPNASYYGASKHALEGYFKSLRFELNEFNIKVAMIEPMAFKTNIFSSSVIAEKKIGDYDNYRYKIKGFEKDLFENAHEPTSVIDTLLKLVKDKNPKFSNPVGKGAKILLALQLFAFSAFENAIMKQINTFKK